MKDMKVKLAKTFRSQSLINILAEADKRIAEEAER